MPRRIQQRGQMDILYTKNNPVHSRSASMERESCGQYTTIVYKRSRESRLLHAGVKIMGPKPQQSPRVENRISKRIATIDWLRGVVMILMVIDHAAMAFNRYHLDRDSALYPNASSMDLPAAEFFTRWVTHLCAPSFVFLAGTALALSVERRA